MKRAHHGAALASIVVVMIALAAIDVRAQSTAIPDPKDIGGSWERYPFGVGSAGRNTPPRANDPFLPPPAPPPPLKSQYLKEWQDRVKAVREAEAKGEPLATGYTHCLPDGMPSMMAAMFPMEILLSKGQVTVIEEAYTQVRRILMDRPLRANDEVEPGFYGHSVGHWEGNTLVVNTIGIKENVRYQNVPHSKELRITERMKLVAPDILWNEITLEDPIMLEKPWTVIYSYRRMPGYTLLEYICEDNREYSDEKGLQRIRIDPTGR